MHTVSLLFHDVFLSDPSESGFSSSAADRYKLPLREFEAQLGALGASGAERLRPERGAGAVGMGPHEEDDARRSRAPRETPRSGVSRALSDEASALSAKRSLPSESERGWGPASTKEGAVRLTFDDGGVSFYTIAANKLEVCGFRAHCFVSTDFIGQSRFLSAAQIRELETRGHAIGTHSASHPARFSGLTHPVMLREWTDSRKMLEDILGHAVTTGSVPGGYFSKAVARAAAEAGLQLLFNSEPVRSTRSIDGCTVAGRFTIRRGARSDLSRKFVHPTPWARSREWAAWNAKGLVKPLLGSSYPRVADWIYGGAR